MKNFFQKMLGKSSKVPVSPPKPKLHECKTHDHRRFPNIQANEACLDCGIKMCYICGNQHMEQKCTVSWGRDENFKKFAEIEKTNQKLSLYNQGFLATLRYEGLKCVCGNPIDTERGGICVACSNAVCSKECHAKYVEETKSCIFHENFSKDLSGQNMISILLKNIKKIYEKPYPVGLRLNRTSSAFVKAFTSPQKNQIYLQRGFRQYGVPQEETLRNLEVINDVNLDYVLHKDRRCNCHCMACEGRSIHPIKNCNMECRQSDDLTITDLFNRDDFQEFCECDCPFCKSGLTVFTHKKQDCFYYCHKNQIKKKGF